MKKILYKKITKEFITSFEKRVKAAKLIGITSHFSPDDDSIASVLSVYHYLTGYLKIAKNKIKILYTGDLNNKWKYFENFNKINFVKDIADHVKNVDLMILLDGSFWNRFSRDEKVGNYKGVTFCIDHHPVLEAEFDFHLNVKEATSTAELVYKLFYDGKNLDKKRSEILLLGILGDTGNFEFIDSSKADILGIAEILIKSGNINVQTFISLYNKISEKEYFCLSCLISNSKIMEIPRWPKFMISFLETSFIKKNKLTDNETSYGAHTFMRYLRAINGVDWGIVITPRLHDQTHSISLRSQPGSINVREMMEKMKIGGGHDRAGGGKIKTFNTKKATDTILNWMRENKPTFS